ncbi:MAG: YcaO-related McrA-glycine thioamidation protein [Methanotrichaceae archaeon]|nr:YcaO-related McrA-glycine thioamidation protein [Methanotrichaceae archaeon]
MRLRSCIKKYKMDTHRALSPEETLERVEPKMAVAGVTRVADITNLDRIGIPVFSSIRPLAAKGAISVYNGKGATPIEARVSAMMEGIERYSGEVGDHKLTLSKFSDLCKNENALNPAALILSQGVDHDAEIDWIKGHDIMNDEDIFVPANAVFHPYDQGRRLFRTNTTGLASGNEVEEAIFHGLAEVIERDAWSLAEASRYTGPLIQNIDNGMATELLEKFAKADVAVHLKDITSDINIPTCAAVSDDLKLRDPTLLTTGMGTHTNASVAVLRALTEVAQSRLTQIHGAREDTVLSDFRKQIGYERSKRLNKYWFDFLQIEEFSRIISYDSDDFLDDINHMISILENSGLDRVIVVDLSREEISVPVVRVIVPGLEISAVDSERIGLRCRNAKDRRFPRSKSA